jgi:hypothetical protein
MLEALFGATLVNADGKTVPVRLVGEQHVLEDLGFIPSFADWARLVQPRPWMLKGQPVDGPSLDPVELSGVIDAYQSTGPVPARQKVRIPV